MLNWKRRLFSIAVMPLAILSGCANTVPPTTPSLEMRQRLGTVAIVPALYNPQTNFATFAKSKPAGAAKGAAVSGGTIALVATAMATPYTMILVPYLATVGAIAGAAGGALETLPAGKSQEIESILNGGVAKLDVQRELAKHLTTIVQKEQWIQLRAVTAMGPTSAAEPTKYNALRQVGIDTVLEVAVREIGFENANCGRGLPNPYLHNFCKDKTQRSMTFFMQVQARLISVSDGAELFARQFRYESPWRDAALWMENNGKLLTEEFEVAYQDIADRIIDEALLVTPIALPTPSIYSTSSNPMPGACWLTPVYPKVERVSLSQYLSPSKDSETCTTSHRGQFSPMRFGIVDSLRPTLSWSSFPRELDKAQLAPALLHKIADVTYDLRIWESEKCERGKQVYERTGLSVNEHQLEEPLKPAQHYFWSVRARFTINGQSMATRWSFFNPNGCYPDDIMDWTYYRFVTPK